MIETIEEHDVHIDLRDSIHASVLSEAQLRTDFTFRLCRKQTSLGDLPLDQWWVRKQGLYGERRKDSPNRQSIVDCFWSLCQAAGSATADRPIQEAYTLAKLLPYARSNASRRVFADASLTKDDKEDDLNRKTVVAQLDVMLKGVRDDELDVASFYRQTGDVLGPPKYDDQVQKCYDDFVDNILGDTCDSFSSHGVDGLQRAIDRWSEKMNKIGRRGGHAIEKTVLDVLSYECRAAFHQCYSAIWLLLLEKLQLTFSLTDESVMFHRFWHLDLMLPSKENADHHLHVFHGHIFGLHPACSDFICTQTGGELLGELVSAPDDVPHQSRVLNGMMIAIHQYAVRRDVAKELRKKQPTSRDVEIVERQQIARKSGRRTSGRRDTDAR